MVNKGSAVHLVRVLPLVALVARLGGLLATPDAAAGAARYEIPADEFFDPMYNPCAGEIIEFTGTVLWIENETPEGMVVHISGIGASAVGQDSGDVYQVNGGLQWVWKINGSETFLHNFRWIGSEPGQRFHMHELYRATYTPDGGLAVEREVLDIECR
jgi:hypothetical protein